MSLWLDLRHGVRIFLRRPGSTALLLLTLALAIGANAAIFSVVDATLFRPLPYPDPDRLVQLVTRFTGGGASGTQISHDGATWEAIRDHARDLDAAVYSGWVKGVNVATSDRAVFLRQQRVGAGFFRVLGVRPLIGREFTREEDRPDGPPVTVLAYSLWQRAFGGRTDVIGRRLTLKGEPHTIVGVMPAAFRTDTDADLWTPLRASRTGEGGGANYGIVARLKPGVVRGVAEQEVAALGASVLERGREGVTARLGLTSLQKGRTGELRQPLLIAWAAVGVVLLIGCANVAGLLLARAASRTREIATRMAIGGGRGAIIRQLLAESLLITAAGAALGLAVGAGLVWWLGRVAEQDLLPIQAPSLDLRVVGVTVLVAAVTGLAAGLAPAIEASLVDFRTALATGGARGVAGGSRHWSRRLLVTAEIAMAVLLLVGAALLVRSVRYLNALDPGFTADHVVAASFSLDDARYASGEKVGALFANGIARLAEVPGVESAAAGLSLPYERGLNMGARRLDGPEAGDKFLITNLTYVTPGLFAVLRIPIVEGRGLQAGDGPDNRPVAVVNEEFARQYLSRQDPGGQPAAAWLGRTHRGRRGGKRAAGHQLGRLRSGGCDSGGLHPRGADQRRVPVAGAHVVLAELDRPHHGPSLGHHRGDRAGRPRHQSARPHRQLPHARRAPVPVARVGAIPGAAAGLALGPRAAAGRDGHLRPDGAERAGAQARAGPAAGAGRLARARAA